MANQRQQKKNIGKIISTNLALKEVQVAEKNLENEILRELATSIQSSAEFTKKVADSLKEIKQALDSNNEIEKKRLLEEIKQNKAATVEKKEIRNDPDVKVLPRQAAGAPSASNVIVEGVAQAGTTVADTALGQTDSDVINKSYGTSKTVLSKSAQAIGLLGKDKDEEDSENIKKTADNVEKLVEMQEKAYEESLEDGINKPSVSVSKDDAGSSSGLQNFFGSFLGTLKGGFISNLLAGITKSLSGIVKTLGVGLIAGLKVAFAPRNILKVLTKVALPLTIITSLASGIIDGFKAWKETGSISEALIAGFGGVLDFLSFGLIDAESIKSAIGWIGEKFDEYITQPLNSLKEWFSELKVPSFEDIMNYDYVKKATDVISKIFTSIPKLILDFVKRIPGVGTLIEKAGGVWDNIKSTTSNLYQESKDVISSAPERIVSGAVSVAKTAADAISSPAVAATPVSAPVSAPSAPQAFSPQLGSGIKKDSGGITGLTAKDKQIMGMIEKHEGKRYKPYKDSLGLWTVGVGHLIGDGKSLPPEMNRIFTEEEIQTMFTQDYLSHKKAAEMIPGYDNLNDNGKAGLIDLTFNMGKSWWKKWPRFTEAVKNGDVSGMVESLRGSKWYTQVGNRAEQVVDLIKNGAGAAVDKVSGYATTAYNNVSKILTENNSSFSNSNSNSNSSFSNNSNSNSSFSNNLNSNSNINSNSNSSFSNSNSNIISSSSNSNSNSNINTNSNLNSNSNIISSFSNSNLNSNSNINTNSNLNSNLNSNSNIISSSSNSNSNSNIISSSSNENNISDLGTIKSGIVSMMGLKKGDPSIEAIFSGTTESERVGRMGGTDPFLQNRNEGVVGFEKAKSAGEFDRTPGIMKTTGEDLSSVAKSYMIDRPAEQTKAATMATAIEKSAMESSKVKPAPVVINAPASQPSVVAPSKSSQVTNIFNAPDMDPSIRRLSDHLLYRSKVW